VVLVQASEDRWCQDGDEHAAEGTTGGNHEEEKRQLTWRRTQSRQLAVTAHTADKQGQGVSQQLIYDAEIGSHVEQAQGVNQNQGQQRRVQRSQVPAIAVEAENKGQQIETERGNPQEGNGGDVHGHLLRRRHQ